MQMNVCAVRMMFVQVSGAVIKNNHYIFEVFLASIVLMPSVYVKKIIPTELSVNCLFHTQQFYGLFMRQCQVTIEMW